MFPWHNAGHIHLHGPRTSSSDLPWICLWSHSHPQSTDLELEGLLRLNPGPHTSSTAQPRQPCGR